jgi:tripartite-type tricarboxylate transporter receptor subunit TctC
MAVPEELPAVPTMTLTRRQFAGGAAASTLLGLAARPSFAQPVLDTARMIIGFAPGGTIDLAGRRVAERLAPGYAKTAVAENRTGAGGQIAVQTVRSAAPDGSTVLITPSSPLSLHLFTYRKLAYDPVADLTPVSGATSFDYALAVGPMVPASVKGVQDFLAWCRSNPANANFGTAGNGSAAHFIGAAIAKSAGVELRHAAFRGSQPAIMDMVGGQLAAVVGPTGEFMPQVRAGKVRLLATSGPKRGKFTPDTPSVAEEGFRDVAYTGWFGFYLPARAPQDVVERLNASIRSALGQQAVVDAFATTFMEPMPTSPAQLAALLKTETEFWGGLAKAVGFTPEG